MNYVSLNIHQVFQALNFACSAESRNCLRTRSLNTELLFNLSSSSNISQSLQTFGAKETDTSVVVVSFNQAGTYLYIHI